MSEFGVVKKAADLGRIVSPKDLRRFLNIEKNDAIIFVPTKEGRVIKNTPKQTDCTEKCSPFIMFI